MDCGIHGQQLLGHGNKTMYHTKYMTLNSVVHVVLLTDTYLAGYTELK